MKRFKGIVIIALAMALCFAAGQVLAGNGKGQGNGMGMKPGQGDTVGPMPDNGKDDGSGKNRPVPIDVLSGEPVTVSGTVSEIAGQGRGRMIDTGTEVVAVYGFGPSWFWEEQGIASPAVGDAITVNGYKVKLSDDTERIIASSVTVGDVQVQLIDAETGMPLWHKSKRPHHSKPVMPDFSTGEDVTVSGVISDIAQRGKRMDIDTEDGVVTVLGLGPSWYWEKIGVTMPEVGDEVTVKGVKLIFDDSTERIIIISITTGGTEVQLHDPETGAPMWRPSI